MDEVEVTFERAAVVWWAWLWRALLFGMLIGAGIGFVLGIAEVMMGLKQTSMVIFNVAVGLIVSVIVNIWVTSKVLKKQFNGFRIVLVY